MSLPLSLSMASAQKVNDGALAGQTSIGPGIVWLKTWLVALESRAAQVPLQQLWEKITQGAEAACCFHKVRRWLCLLRKLWQY